MGRGSRGFGAQSVLCWRVVLDANCARGAPVSELRLLSQRGYTVHLSLEALREIWTRSVREDNYELLAQRLNRLAPLLDPKEPIAFVGHALWGAIRGQINGEEAAFRMAVLAGWQEVVRSGLTRGSWRDIGNEMQQELRRDEEAWRGHIAQARKMEEERLALNAKYGPAFCSSSRWKRALIGGLVQGNGPRLNPALEVRAAVHLRYYASKLANAREREPSSNDFFDARHLQHVAWPSFLATTDFRLIEAVDATCPAQAAWVRSPVELIEDRIFRCEPWGKGSKRLVSFRREPLATLKLRQEEFRRRLKALAG